jgi:hypothetical protein
MLPGAKRENLLYAAGPTYSDKVYVVSYPALEPVGTLAGFHRPVGVCIDRAQDVWIVNTESGYPTVVEYAHGGTSPIATLLPGGYPDNCSVDRTTGNLAVSEWYPAGVAVFAHASGQPTIYSDSSAFYFYHCSYDSFGNLYASGVDKSGGFIFAELPAGSSMFTNISLKKLRPNFSSSIQWDGRYIDIVDGARDHHRKVYRVSVSGGIGKVVASLALREARGRGQPWIERGAIILSYPSKFSHVTTLALWRYPSGGEPSKVVDLGGTETFGDPVGEPGVGLSLGK